MGSTRTVVAIVGGAAALVLLGSGSAGGSLPRAVAPSPRKRSPAPLPKPKPAAKVAPKRSRDPEGIVTLGPITQIKTRDGTTVESIDLRTLTPAELAAYKLERSLAGDRDTDLLTDEQWKDLDGTFVDDLPGSGSPALERAKRAAQLAAATLGVPKIPIKPQPAPPQADDEDDDQGDDDDDGPAYQVIPAAKVPKGAIVSKAKPAPINLELARREAPAVAKHIAQKGRLYSHQTLKAFQSHAGIANDGIYGPMSNSALRYFGVVNPPEPLFKGKPGSSAVYIPT